MVSGCETPTLKRVWEGGKVYHEMVCYNQMHVKTRLSQSIYCQRLQTILSLHNFDITFLTMFILTQPVNNPTGAPGENPRLSAELTLLRELKGTCSADCTTAYNVQAHSIIKYFISLTSSVLGSIYMTSQLG